MKNILKDKFKSYPKIVYYFRILRWGMGLLKRPTVFMITVFYLLRLKRCGLPVDFSKTIIIRNPKNIEIGRGCSFSNYVILDGHDQISIGNDCMFANRVTVATATHDYNVDPMNSKIITAPTVIKDNVWIGIGSTIMHGVEVGEGSVIGAMSLVKSNVVPRTIVAGVPAKIIKKRRSSVND